MIYAGLDETDQALTWLEKGYEQLFNPSILVRPAFDPLRSDRRFQDLPGRIGPPITNFKGRTNVELFCTTRFAAGYGKALCTSKL